jgi:hypothetical protein
MASAVGWYLYAFLFPAELPPRSGIDGMSPVRLFARAGVGALSCPVPLVEFGEEGLQRNAQDTCWLEEKVRHHESVVEAAMSTGPVLPMKFGTIFLDAARIDGLIEANLSTLRASLEELRDKEEWGVRGFANRAILRTATLQHDPTLRALSEAAGAESAGQAFFLRKRVEALASAQSLERGQALAREARETIQKAVVALTDQRSLITDASEDEEIVLNMACLVKGEEVGAFLAAADRLNQDHAGEGLRLLASGPWPPYHFVPRLEENG